MNPPQEIVVKLLDAGLLERRDLAALRIEAFHHVADRAVLAGRVHALQHHQQRAAVLGVEPIAEVAEDGDVLIDLLAGRLLVPVAGDVPRVEFAEVNILVRRRDNGLSSSWCVANVG